MAGQSSVKKITSALPHDLTRDPYMPERQVMVKEIIPPANEAEIMEALTGLLGKDHIHADGPREPLCEFWKRGTDLLVCAANLRRGHDGGPLNIHLGPYRAKTALVYRWFDEKPETIQIKNNRVVVEPLPHFAAVVVKDVLG